MYRTPSICIPSPPPPAANANPKMFKYKSTKKSNVENRCVSPASHVAIERGPDLSSFFGANLSAFRHMGPDTASEPPL
jgi:hypothetical protein